MKRILFFSLLLVALGVQAVEPPNILFAFADDWGRHASAYAKVDGRPSPNDIIKTPHFDRMAREGRKLTSFYSASGVCTPSRAALMTGS